jgi:siroheme synthase-like protein
MSRYYPVLLKLEGKRCIVAGDRWAAEERVRGLLDAGAAVTVISPELCPALKPLLEARAIEWIAREYRAGDLEGCFLVVAAARDPEVSSRVFRDAESAGVLASAVDDEQHSRFIYPAIHRQGDLIVTVSSSGRSPALASRLRDRFASETGPEYARLLELLGGLRLQLRERFPDFEERKRVCYELVDSAALELLHAGNERGARELLASILENASDPNRRINAAG